jgi:acetyl esterase/lipase
MTGAKTLNSPNWYSDFMFKYNETTLTLNDMLRPSNLPYDTPAISALLVEDVGKLPPQFVFWAPTEILWSDSTRWIERSRQAGVEITEHVGYGEMHTYAMGWPICSQKTQNECDVLLVEYILNHVT